MEKSKEFTWNGKEEGFTQVCVWPGTLVGVEQIEDFEKWFANMGYRVKYLEEIRTFPDIKDGQPVENTGERNDVFFAVHKDDIFKFSVPRLKIGIRWVEDVLAPGNYRSPIYPERVFNYRNWGDDET